MKVWKVTVKLDFHRKGLLASNQVSKSLEVGLNTCRGQ